MVVPAIAILLSKSELDTNEPGYQPPCIKILPMIKKGKKIDYKISGGYMMEDEYEYDEVDDITQ